MQIRSTMKHDYTPIRLSKRKITAMAPNASKSVENWITHAFPWKWQDGAATLGRNLVISYKTVHTPIIQPRSAPFPIAMETYIKT